MNVNDILEIEQIKYSYEQAYAMHRQSAIPQLFVRSEESVFSIPSVSDYVVGWDKIYHKFVDELNNVPLGEDTFHTGWQICIPFIWEDTNTKKVSGIFPTFGFFAGIPVCNDIEKYYNIAFTMELWQDSFEKTVSGWGIKNLCAQFLLGQDIWRWNVQCDDTFATRRELGKIPHPLFDHYEEKEGNRSV